MEFRVFVLLLLDFSLVVVVRGYIEQSMTWTLKQVASLGGEIFYVGHEEYKHRHDLEHWQQHSELAQFLSSHQLPGITEATWIGEGGRIMDSDMDRNIDIDIHPHTYTHIYIYMYVYISYAAAHAFA